MSNIIPFIPIGYQMRVRDLEPYHIVISNWLKLEAMPREALARHPILRVIAGWRNAECYAAVSARDWTARMYSPEQRGPSV